MEYIYEFSLHENQHANKADLHTHDFVIWPHFEAESQRNPQEMAPWNCGTDNREFKVA